MRLFLLLITISISSTTLVEWVPNRSFNLPINFRDHKLPCSKQAVVFPQRISEGVEIKSEFSIKEFILPSDGELLLDDAEIVFGMDEHDNCTDSGNSYYIPKAMSSWSDPDVWSSSKYNEATPDAERVPCYDDDVNFPAGSQFTINLPSEKQYVQSVTVKGLKLDQRAFTRFALFGRDSEQNFVMNRVYGTGLDIGNSGCTKPLGCPCQKNPLKIDCTLKFCKTPQCVDPVQPMGHCCKICGGYLQVDTENSFDMLAFEENVAEILGAYGEQLVYHIGILPNNKVQLVVVEKHEYTGASAEAVHEVEYKSNSRGLQSLAHISGGPSSKAGFGAKIAFSMLCLVVLAMGGIYVYYYKTPKLPEFSYPAIGRSTRGMLTRFSRRTESVVSLTSRRDSTATIRSSGRTAFRNPMYDSRRGRVQVTESVEEE